MKRFTAILFYVLLSLDVTSYGQNIDLHQYFDDLENLEVSLITAAPSDLVYGTWGPVSYTHLTLPTMLPV